MAGFATNTFGNVNVVVEVNIVRHTVNSIPLERSSIGIAITNWLQIGSRGPDLTMTSHTGFGRGQIGKCRLVNTDMSVTTIQFQRCDVQTVWKRNRLWDSHSVF
jgi:hypothetical protein